MMTENTFNECRRCAGYGVRDNGNNCTNCGGSGTGGLHSTNGCIGSGEVITETATGRVVPISEFATLMKASVQVSK